MDENLENAVPAQKPEKGTPEQRPETGASEQKSYQKVVEYVNQGIQDRKLKPGDRLPAERELAEELDISRNSVREGLRVMENIGILDSRRGSGNDP